jgi:hypothetical protein
MNMEECQKLGIANCNRLVKDKSELQRIIKEVEKGRGFEYLTVVKLKEIAKENGIMGITKKDVLIKEIEKRKISKREIQKSPKREIQKSPKREIQKSPKSIQFNSFIEAIKNGDVKTLIKMNLTKKQLQQNSEIAIIEAVNNRQVNILMFLRRNGFTAKNVRALENKPLLDTIKKGYDEILKEFKKWGLTKEDTKPTGFFAPKNALIAAAKFNPIGGVNVIRELHNNWGFDMEDAREDYSQVLHEAISNNNIHMLNEFIENWNFTKDDFIRDHILLYSDDKGHTFDMKKTMLDTLSDGYIKLPNY